MELHLKRGDELMGVLRSKTTDFPWVNCEFEPTESFVKVKPLFEEELTLLDADRMDEWQIAYDRISALGLRLMDPKVEKDIGEFVLHIRGKRGMVSFLIKATTYLTHFLGTKRAAKYH